MEFGIFHDFLSMLCLTTNIKSDDDDNFMLYISFIWSKHKLVAPSLHHSERPWTGNPVQVGLNWARISSQSRTL